MSQVKKKEIQKKSGTENIEETINPDPDQEAKGTKDRNNEEDEAMSSKETDPQKPTEESNETKEENETEVDLPENVTLGPQDPEHMDLSQMQKQQLDMILRPYLSVSNDKGEFIGDLDLEREVKTMCKDLEVIDLEKVKNAKELFDTISDLALRYTPKINGAENISQGILTKYRIRLGMLLIALKYIIKYKLNGKWTDWVGEKFGKSFLRSAQDYMRIAETKNIIKYAVFGTGRLLQVIKRLVNQRRKMTPCQRPILTPLKSKKISFSVL